MKENIRKFIILILLLPIRLYRILLSPYMGGQCRYHPSCSIYAEQAISQHGFIGLVLSLRRLLNCHPWGGMGYDPVPDKMPSLFEGLKKLKHIFQKRIEHGKTGV